MTGGELLAESLATLGVREVFALHGGHLDSFLVACADHGIRITDTRHEAAAGHAADGFARARGAPIGVCAVTAGPGFTNVLTAMANAFLDGVATLFIAGAPPLREVETNPLQGGFDQVAMALPVSKWAMRITHGERIPDLVRRAVRVATSGRPGPVMLEIPIDVMFMPVDPERSDRRQGPLADFRPGPSPDAVAALAALLGGAERPVMVAGGGVVLSPEAPGLLAQFARVSGIPVVHNYRAAGVLPPGHPFNLGGVGVLAGRSGGGPDAIVLLGARRGMFLGGRGNGVINEGATVAQVDIDPGEIGRLGPVALPVVADVAETLRALIPATQGWTWPDWSGWRAKLEQSREAARGAFAGVGPQTNSRAIHPHRAAIAVMRALPADAVWVLDGGEAASWFASLIVPSGPGQFMATGYLGCLGVAPGFSIGAQRAHPHQLVVSVTGDGGLGFNIQEFDTMVRHRLPILTIVMNNAAWGMSQSGQDIIYGRNRRTAVALRDTDYDKVAVAFGGFGARVEREMDIAAAIGQAIASGKPACVNIITDPQVSHPVTAAMVGVVENPGEVLIPYYENIPAAP